MIIKSGRLDLAFNKYQKEYEEKAIEVLRSGWYILGKEVSTFENEFALYNDSKYCVGLASGLDSLWISLKLLGIKAGDEVIIQANAYIACVMAITINGATPVFVEPDETFQINVSRIEEKITPKTKAVLVVHLYGVPAKLDKIEAICKKNNLVLIEDCAQAHGAMYKGKKVGTFGKIGCFSFYPSKNLGAFGDAGAIITTSNELNKTFRVFRNYGSDKKYYNCMIGANSRLDELQAGLLRVKLKHLEEYNEEKKIIAKRYLEYIYNPLIRLPVVPKESECVWHQFVICCDERDKLKRYLSENGIETNIHYPIPPHLSEAYKYLGYKKDDFPITERYADTMLSLPTYNGMTEEEQKYILNTINGFEV